jgi:hypothetical protein
MPDFTDRIPFIERTRWLMLKACMTDGVHMKKFSKDVGMSEARIRDLLFSDKSDIADINLRELSDWFYCSMGRVPEFSIVPMGPWSLTERPL